jgi:hypothetical protein
VDGGGEASTDGAAGHPDDEHPSFLLAEHEVGRIGATDRASQGVRAKRDPVMPTGQDERCPYGAFVEDP